MLVKTSPEWLMSTLKSLAERVLPLPLRCDGETIIVLAKFPSILERASQLEERCQPHWCSEWLDTCPTSLEQFILDSLQAMRTCDTAVGKKACSPAEVIGREAWLFDRELCQRHQQFVEPIVHATAKGFPQKIRQAVFRESITHLNSQLRAKAVACPTDYLTLVHVTTRRCLCNNLTHHHRARVLGG